MKEAGIRLRNPSIRAAADPFHRTRDNWDRQVNKILSLNVESYNADL